MILLLLLILVGSYIALASWAVHREGSKALWMVTLALLLGVLLSAILVSLRYDVPSVSRVIVYALTFCGPVILLPTLFLSWGKNRGMVPRATLPLTLAGIVLGLGCGLIWVIYGLRVW